MALSRRQVMSQQYQQRPGLQTGTLSSSGFEDAGPAPFGQSGLAGMMRAPQTMSPKLAFPMPQGGQVDQKALMGLLLTGMGKIQQHYDMSGNLINPGVAKPRGLDEFYAMQRPNADGSVQSSPMVTPPMGVMRPHTPLPPVEQPVYKMFTQDTPTGHQLPNGGYSGAGVPFSPGSTMNWNADIDPVTGQPRLRPNPTAWIQRMFGK